jgi:hypothetical protein
MNAKTPKRQEKRIAKRQATVAPLGDFGRFYQIDSAFLLAILASWRFTFSR